MDPFLGEIRMFAGTYAPRGWAFCNGQLLSIAQNTALFSRFGTTYGGNGQTTFALPDLRGRAPVHFGQGPGLSHYNIGQKSGAENVALTVNHLPPHSHTVMAINAAPDSGDPNGRLLAVPGRRAKKYSTGAANVVMSAATIGSAGSGQPLPILPPYLAINYIIALQGIFPFPA